LDAFFSLPPLPTLPEDPTRADIENLIAALFDRISVLREILASRSEGLQGSVSQIELSRLLSRWDEGDDVVDLQIFLRDQGSRIYPQGIISGHFGVLTEQAVGRFQLRHDIVRSSGDEGYGMVGPKTRAKILSCTDESVCD